MAFSAMRSLAVPATRSFGVRSFAAGSDKPKVALLGAAGGIGQPLSLLLKTSNRIGSLALFDVGNAAGVAADVSHIAGTSVKEVKGYRGDEEIAAALTGAKVVIIPAGVPRKPGMTRDDLFAINAGIVWDLATACAKYCPEAVVCVISNPVNSTVPIAAKAMKAVGTHDKRKVIGVTTLDVQRAKTFLSEMVPGGIPAADMQVPVIGGHAGTTILPLLSQSKPALSLKDDVADKLTTRIQFGGDEVVEAKQGAGSATLSMAFAAHQFNESLLAAMQGEAVEECCFVESTVTDCQFFASPVRLGPNGAEEVKGFGQLNAAEKVTFDKMMPDLKAQVQKGLDYTPKKA